MIFFGIAIGIFVLECWIKGKIERPNKQNRMVSGGRDGMAAGIRAKAGDSIPEDKEILNHRILLRRYHNHGIAFDIMEKHHSLVSVLSTIMTGFVAFMLGSTCFDKEKKQTGLQLGLALLLGGALSNTYDRVRRGYVVDYFSFQSKWKKLKGMVFNISDMFIFLGSFLTAIFR